MSEKKTTKKMGRPKLPKGEAKGRIVPVRFTEAELKMFAKAVKYSDHNTLSAWIRHTLRQAAENVGSRSKIHTVIDQNIRRDVSEASITQ